MPYKSINFARWQIHPLQQKLMLSNNVKGRSQNGVHGTVPFSKLVNVILYLFWKRSIGGPLTLSPYLFHFHLYAYITILNKQFYCHVGAQLHLKRAPFFWCFTSLMTRCCLNSLWKVLQVWDLCRPISWGGTSLVFSSARKGCVILLKCNTNA